MISHSFTIPVDGHPMPCYLARPDESDGAPVPAVIVLQEVFGVNREVKRIADLVAGAGYVALAPNYYHRDDPDLNEPYTPEGLQAGFKAAAKVSHATLKADVGAARDWLDSQPFVHDHHIATWGFCFGGAVSYVASTLPGISASICFYGGFITAPFPNGDPPAVELTPEVKAPLLLAYGGQDEWIKPENIAATTQRLCEYKKRFDIQVYPDVGHAFFRQSSENLDTKTVSDAWERVQAFLEVHLR